MKPEVNAFFHEPSNTVSYVVKDPDSDSAAIIDPVLDFDAKSGRTSTTSADQLIADVEERGLGVAWILETHAHADHLSAAPYIRSKVGGRVGIGEHLTEVQALFKNLFNVEKTFKGTSKIGRIWHPSDFWARHCAGLAPAHLS
ncbi:MAG: MBL fold metallo-hydrolase [Alphaproteobacteria bacterium]|nr:MBL fold metallo-hydrolase [Alphaproteobacteria bacterium]